MAATAIVPQPGQLLQISNRQQFKDGLRPGALQCAAANGVVCIGFQRVAGNTHDEAARLTDQRMLPAARAVVEEHQLAGICSREPHYEGCAIAGPVSNVQVLGRYQLLQYVCELTQCIDNETWKSGLDCFLSSSIAGAWPAYAASLPASPRSRSSTGIRHRPLCT
jgi:hypothetical protein